MARKNFGSPVYQATVIMQAGQAFGELWYAAKWYGQARLPKRQAQQKLSQRLGHQRLEVLKRYLSPSIAGSDNQAVQDQGEPF